MKSFKDMGVKISSRAFVGDKFKIDRLLNKEIAVLHFKIEDSTKKAGTKCLYLQVKLGDTTGVLFTGASALIEAIRQVPQENFPFTTTIVKDNDRYEFS